MTADHVIVVGQGRLIADMPIADADRLGLGRTRSGSARRTPRGCATRWPDPDVTVSSTQARRPGRAGIPVEQIGQTGASTTGSCCTN